MERKRLERLDYKPDVSERFLGAVESILIKDSVIWSTTIRKVGDKHYVTTGYLSTPAFTAYLTLEDDSRLGGPQANLQRVNDKGELEQTLTVYADGTLGFYPEKNLYQTKDHDDADIKKALEFVEQFVPLKD